MDEELAVFLMFVLSFGSLLVTAGSAMAGPICQWEACGLAAKPEELLVRGVRLHLCPRHHAYALDALREGFVLEVRDVHGIPRVSAQVVFR